MSENTDEQVIESCQLYLDILKDLRVPLAPGAAILDFGCGSGQHVYFLREMGFRGFGCDFNCDFSKALSRMRQRNLIANNESVLRDINTSQYAIPFEDNQFDFLFSNQVFEHVQNYADAIREIKRVLKPGGCSLHIFPSRYRLIEGHVYVPFGGVFRSLPYLRACAFLGIRNSFQKGRDHLAVAKSNYEFLHNETMYYSKNRIRECFSGEFDDFRFVEDVFLKFSKGRSHHIYGASKHLPFLVNLYSTLKTRVIFFRKPSA